jgi:hypothetical protein
LKIRAPGFAGQSAESASIGGQKGQKPISGPNPYFELVPRLWLSQSFLTLVTSSFSFSIGVGRVNDEMVDAFARHASGFLFFARRQRFQFPHRFLERLFDRAGLGIFNGAEF